MSFRCLRLILFVGLGSIGFADACFAQVPIPTGPDSYTLAMYRRDAHAWQLRRLKVYEQHTQDPADVRADVVKFFDDFTATRLFMPGHRSWKELSATAKQLQKRGSTDPLAALFRARAQSLSNDGSVRFETEVWRCYDALAKTDYPARWKAEPLGQLDFGWPRRVPKGKPSAEELLRQLADAWLLEPDATDDDRRFRWEYIEWMFERFDIEDQTVFHDRCLEHEKADPWLSNLLSGTYHINVAWHHRGSGYADTVTEAGAIQFDKHIRIASQKLQAAWDVDPKLPEPAAKSIITAMAGVTTTASERQWFDRAVAAQMDHSPAYESYLQSLRPRWGGSFEQLYKFGQECLATKRFDTEVPRFLVLAIYDISDDLEGHYEVFRNERTWAEVHDVYAGLLAEYERQPNYNDPRAIVTQWMLYAIHSGHFDDACTALKMVDERGWNLDVRQHNVLRLRETSARSIVAGVGGPAAVAARKAVPLLMGMKMQRMDPKTRDVCLTALDEVVEKDPSDLVLGFFGHWRQTLLWEKAYDAGEWVDLSFNPKMIGWVLRRGRWDYQTDGSVVAMRSGETENVEAFCNARFPGAYEVRAKTALPEGGKNQVAPSVCVFVEFGVAVDAATSSSIRRFWIAPVQGRVGITDGYDQHFGNNWPLKATESNEIHLQIWPTDFLFEANGCDVFIDKPTPEMARERIALNTAFHLDPDTPVRFEGVRVRKLKLEAPPAESDGAAGIAYYSMILKAEPDDVTALIRRARGFKVEKRYEEAAKDLDRALELKPDVGNIHFLRGTVAQNLNDYVRAIAFYEAGVEREPLLIGAWKELAWTCASCPDKQFRDGARALAAAKRACEITKNRDYVALTVLSAAYAELGEHDQAIEAAKRAMIFAPKERKDQAKAFLKRREARKPEFDEGAKKTEASK